MEEDSLGLISVIRWPGPSVGYIRAILGFMSDIRGRPYLLYTGCKRAACALCRIYEGHHGSYVGYKRAIVGLMPAIGRCPGIIQDLTGNPWPYTKYKRAS